MDTLVSPDPAAGRVTLPMVMQETPHWRFCGSSLCHAVRVQGGGPSVLQRAAEPLAPDSAQPQTGLLTLVDQIQDLLCFDLTCFEM